MAEALGSNIPLPQPSAIPRLLVQNSHKALRWQNEQAMTLRRDMMKHFRLLRRTAADTETAAYMDKLTNEEIRPVVQSGKEMPDVILNGRLSTAADAGIAQRDSG